MLVSEISSCECNYDEDRCDYGAQGGKVDCSVDQFRTAFEARYVGLHAAKRVTFVRKRVQGAKPVKDRGQSGVEDRNKTSNPTQQEGWRNDVRNNLGEMF